MYIRGDMNSIYPEFALYGSQIRCARTDTPFSPLPEVSTRAGTLIFLC